MQHHLAVFFRNAIVMTTVSTGAFVAAAPASAQGLFKDAPQQWRTGVVPLYITPADLNADGMPDLIIFGKYQMELSVMIANGPGSFQPARTTPVGFESRNLRIADFNLDGRLDVLVSRNEIYIYPGDGTGGLGAPIITNAQGGVLAPGDVNQDGATDLVFAHATGGLVDLFINFNDGSFYYNNTFVTSSAAVSTISAMELTDVNADGVRDILYAHMDRQTAGSTAKSMLSWMPGVGATFGPPIPTTIQSKTCGVNCAGLLLSPGDWNHDAYLDAAILDSNPTLNCNVFAGTAGGGFASIQKIDMIGTRGFATGDWDGDGNRDLAFSFSAPGFLIYKGDATGHFALFCKVSELSSPNLIVSADFNADGNADFAVTDFVSSVKIPGIVNILLGDGQGCVQQSPGLSLDSPILQLDAADFLNHGNLDLVGGLNTPAVNPVNRSCVVIGGDGSSNAGMTTFSNTGFLVGGNEQFAGVRGQDRTHDGIQDVTVTMGALHAVSNASAVRWMSGDGSGALIPQATAQAPNVESGSLTSGTADLNNDGNPDVLFGYYRITNFSKILYFAPGNSSGGFEPVSAVSLQKGIYGNFDLADFDQDGILDIFNFGTEANLTSVEILRGAGDGSFTTISTHDAGGVLALGGVAAGDLNNDGWPDFVANSDTAAFSTWIGAGQGVYGTAVDSPAIINNTSTNPSILRIADMTGDGIVDLLAIRATITVLPGFGDGTFGAPFGTSTSIIRDYTICDWDGDGYLDILYLESDGRVRFLLNRAGDSPPAGTQTSGAGTPGCHGRHGIAAANSAQLGNLQFTVTTTNAPRNTLGIVMITDAVLALPQDLFQMGFLVHLDLLTTSTFEYFDLVSDGIGHGVGSYPVPNTPGLAGLSFYLQSFWFEAECGRVPFGLSSSNLLTVVALP